MCLRQHILIAYCIFQNAKRSFKCLLWFSLIYKEITGISLMLILNSLLFLQSNYKNAIPKQKMKLQFQAENEKK